MYDIIIIGAGPAGLTAALYALRAGKSALIIEKETFGGQINDQDLIKILGINKNTFYKYKKELQEDLSE